MTERPTPPHDPRVAVSRRQALRAGIGGLGLTMAPLPRFLAPQSRADALILVVMIGGPSTLETFDPKPDAPTEVRGAGRSIASKIPGVRLDCSLPELARRLDRFTLLRSLTHTAAPIHETGLQLLQTGKLARPGLDPVHLGALCHAELGPRPGATVPTSVILPGPLGSTGVSVSQGQPGSLLDESASHVVLPSSFDDPESIDSSARSSLGIDLEHEPRGLVEAYGPTAFGRSCLLAARLVELGARVVTINMFPTVFGRASWDCHGRSPFSSPDTVARQVAPAFDHAFSALLDDLQARGLLDRTLLAACGEMGRTPRLNATGGRDHWTGAFSALLAGGSLPPGTVLGETDSIASEPTSDPVSLSSFAGFLGSSLGLRSSGLPDPDVFSRWV